MTNDAYNRIGQYFSGRPVESPGASVKDIANMIILNAERKGSQKKKPESNDPSFVGRIFDVLSRPNYAVAEFVREWNETGDPDISAALEGLSGKKKTTFSKVLEEAGMDNNPQRAFLGLGLDVLLDPTTYVGAGLVSKLGKLDKTATVAKVPEKPKNLEELNLNTEAPLAFKRPTEDIETTAEALRPQSVQAVRMSPDVRQKYIDTQSGDIVKSLTAKTGEAEAAVRSKAGLRKEMLASGAVPTVSAKFGISKEILDSIKNLDQMKLSPANVPEIGSYRNKTSNILGDISKAGSPVEKAIQSVRDRFVEADQIKKSVDAAVESKEFMKSTNVLSDGELVKFEKYAKDFTRKVNKNLTPDAQSVAKTVTNLALMSGKSAAQLAVESKAKILDDVISTGKQHTEVNRALTLGLEKDLSKLPEYALHKNKVFEMTMGRMATWWGQADLRRKSLEMISSSANTAAARGVVIDKMFKAVTPDEALQAMKSAQGLGGPVGNPKVAELSDQIQKTMDNLVGQVSGGSVLTRSGVSLNNLNKWMKFYDTGIEFGKGVKKNKLGESLDLTKGTDWAQSWKLAEVTNPKLFMFKVQQAMEQATREKALFDQLGEELGSTVYGKGYTTKLKGYDYVDGYYFPPEIAKQLPRVIKDWSTESWKGHNALLGHYDRVLSMWKAGVTIYRPGHHIRNLIGDVYLGWMDGVNSMKPYLLAARVQKMSGSYQTMADVDRLVDVGALGKEYKAAQAGEVLFKNKSGVPFTGDQIYAVAHQKGLLEHVNVIEDLLDMGSDVKRTVLDIKPFGGKVQAVARGASELQSHNARLAHFIDKVMKSRGKNLNTIFTEAADRSRKWHPSSVDLTQAEKKVGRRVVPFYTWIRKSVPLMLEGLVMNPGKAVIPSKVLQAVQEAQGIETPGREDPFPVDQMFPSWIKDQGIGPVGLPEGLLGSFTNQTPPGYAIMGMGLNPMTDLISQIQNPGKSLSSMITPAVQLPMELLSGKESFTSEPIMGPEARPGAFGEYVGENIPGVSALQSLTGYTPFGDKTKAATRSDQATTEAFANFLTGLGIKGTGPYVRQATYEKSQEGNAAKKFNREQFYADLRRRLEGQE